MERADRAADFLRARGREPRRVPDNVLLPLLEAGSLEEDESLAEKWSALLANATDPAAEAVPPAFPEILRQLSSDDARLLDHMVHVPATTGRPRIPVTVLQHQLQALLRTGPIQEPERFSVALDNLLRLRLATEHTYTPPTRRPMSAAVSMSEPAPLRIPGVRVTALGAAFARACSAGTALPEEPPPNPASAPAEHTQP